MGWDGIAALKRYTVALCEDFVKNPGEYTLGFAALMVACAMPSYCLPPALAINEFSKPTAVFLTLTTGAFLYWAKTKTEGTFTSLKKQVVKLRERVVTARANLRNIKDSVCDVYRNNIAPLKRYPVTLYEDFVKNSGEYTLGFAVGTVICALTAPASATNALYAPTMLFLALTTGAFAYWAKAQAERVHAWLVQAGSDLTRIRECAVALEGHSVHAGKLNEQFLQYSNEVMAMLRTLEPQPSVPQSTDS